MRTARSERRYARTIPALFAGTLCIALMAGGQSVSVDGTHLTAEQIAGHLEAMNGRRDAALKSYESRRVMTLMYKGLLTNKRASETVLMTFTAPGTKDFKSLSESGSRLLRDNVFQREIDNEQAAAGADARLERALTPANYNLRLVGEAQLPQGDCYILEVSPKTRSRFGYSGRVWVQSTDFAVVRIQAQPSENPSFWVEDGQFTSTFEKIGNFWLPSQTVSTSHVRLGGDATFDIQFGPYRILDALPVSATVPQLTK